MVLWWNQFIMLSSNMTQRSSPSKAGSEGAWGELLSLEKYLPMCVRMFLSVIRCVFFVDSWLWFLLVSLHVQPFDFSSRNSLFSGLSELFLVLDLMCFIEFLAIANWFSWWLFEFLRFGHLFWCFFSDLEFVPFCLSPSYILVLLVWLLWSKMRSIGFQQCFWESGCW